MSDSGDEDAAFNAQPPKLQKPPKQPKQSKGDQNAQRGSSAQQNAKNQQGQKGGGKGKGKDKSGAGGELAVPKSVQNLETYATLNSMLHSASLLVMEAFANGAFGDSQNRGDEIQGAESSKAAQVREAGKHACALARKRMGEVKSLAKKAQISLDSSIKREICKRCDLLLIPAISNRIRVKKFGPHGHVIEHECLHCGFKRRIPAPSLGPPPKRKSAQILPGNTPMTRSAVKTNASEQNEDQMHVDVQPGSQPEPAAQKRGRVPQRQRRKAGNLARLVAKRIEEEVKCVQTRSSPQNQGDCKGKNTAKPIPTRALRKDRRLAILNPERGPLPEILERGARIAERRLRSQRVLEATEMQRTPAPAAPFRRYTNRLARKHGRPLLPNKTEQKMMEALECRYRIRKKHASKRGTPRKTLEEGKKSTSKRWVRLPPYFERMKGSSWARHLVPTRLRGTEKGKAHEEVLHKRYLGNHVMLQDTNDSN